MKKTALALFCGVLLAACSSEPVRTPPLQLDYSQLGKIYLNTREVRVIDRSAGRPARPPYVGHMFQPRLADAASRWAQDRLQATGSMGQATFIIKEASVQEQPLRTVGGIDSWFTRQQASKYVGRIEVQLDAQSPVNNTVGSATAHATYATTLPEKPTEAEKNAAYREILEGIMRDLNRKLEQAIQQHLRAFLGTGESAAMDAPLVISAPAARPSAPSSGRVTWSPDDEEPEPLPPATVGPPRPLRAR